MRIDTRKSLMLSDSQQLTPTTNLLNPAWRKSFQDALLKLSGTVDIVAPPAVDPAVSGEAAVDAARLNYSKLPSSPTVQNAGEGRVYADRLERSAQRISPRVSAVDRPGEVPYGPGQRRGVDTFAAFDTAGNTVAATLGNRHPLIAGAANIALPFLTPLWSKYVQNPVADLTPSTLTASPELQVGGVLAREEARRLQTPVGQFSSSPELSDAYRVGNPYAGMFAGDTMSQAERNARLLPGEGMSAWLGRASPLYPVLGAAVPAIAATGQDLWEGKGLRIAEDPVFYTSSALTPAAAWAAARSMLPLSGAVSKIPYVGTTLARIPAVGTAMAAAGAMQSVGEIARGALSPERVDEARRASGTDTGWGTATGRAVVGDPFGAATALDPEAVEANKREFLRGRRDIVEDASGTRIPFDRDMVIQRLSRSAESAPSVPNSILSELVAKGLWTDGGLKHMAKERYTRETPAERGAYRMAQRFADQKGFTPEDPRRIELFHQQLKKMGITPSAAGDKRQWIGAAKTIASALENRFPGVRISKTGIVELANLVRTNGVEATAASFMPTGRPDDALESLRLQAILNSAWADPSTKAQAGAIYQQHFQNPR